MSRASAPRRLRTGRVLWLGLGALALGGLALGASRGPEAAAWTLAQLRAPRFQLRTLEFLGLHSLAAEELAVRSGLIGGVPLIDIAVRSVRERVCTHPRIAACSVARIPPDLLVFEIEERVPVARLAERELGVALDGGVFPLQEKEAAGLTVLRGPVEPALPLLEVARRLGVELGTLLVRDASDLRFQPRGRDIEVRVGTEPERSLTAWLRLADSERLRASAAHEVDLRFRGHAVLRDFSKTKTGGDEQNGTQ
ncbi:MAG: cell division protein FtsQ/DivIB [Myxococcota bacterium]